jgi:lipopolysaccharide/colanic/teichoic acid biosynthesis glycosyltransferase
LASLVFRDEEELLAHAADPVWFNDKVLFPSKVRINLEYLNRVSLFEDIRLILLTILPFRVRHTERERVEQTLISNRRQE